MVDSQGSAKRTRIPPVMEPLGPSVEHEVADRMEVSNNYNRSGPLGWTKDRKGDSTKMILPTDTARAARGCG